MYLHTIFFLFVVLQMSSANDDILELTDSDFSARIVQHETALVMFYAPWCGHCKKLKPEFGKASRDLMRTAPSVSLLKIDCTVAGKETCTKFDVDGYPTLKIFRNGKFLQNYEGSREAGGIVDYMKAQAAPVSKELISVAELRAFLKAEGKVCVVGFFAKELDLKNAFLQVAETRRGEVVRFAHSTSKQVLEKEGIADGIVLYRPGHLRSKFENDSVIYSGCAKTKEINDFIARNYHGLVGHRSLTNKDDFHNPLVVAYYAVDYVNNPKGTNYWRNRVLKVAQHYKDKVNFAISATDEFQSELEEYGPVDDNKPFVVARNAKNQKFVLQEPFTVDVFDRFVQDLLSNKLVPYLKTQPIPQSKGVVKVAVAKNFQEVVVDNGRDTLVEFYAPWCGHCKKLATIYDNLGEKMKDEAVDIVKMDATANDVPAKYDVTGFPTLYWVPKGNKDNPVRYEGGRELNDFIKYIAEHASSELKGYDRSGTPKVGKTEL